MATCYLCSAEGATRRVPVETSRSTGTVSHSDLSHLGSHTDRLSQETTSLQLLCDACIQQQTDMAKAALKGAAVATGVFASGFAVVAAISVLFFFVIVGLTVLLVIGTKLSH